jgi:predicted GH43/DUF377 family glycosyl hydrolase
MKNLILIFVLVGLVAGCSNEPDVYMFSYFQRNGEDGLHLAYSEDGFNWTALNKNISFLKPEAGQDKLMRDPCIIKGDDGKFHMVWTVSWNEKGIGYAWSEDLINWSEQQYIPVMEHEPDARNCWAPELFWDEDSRQYMIYWATTIPGRFPMTEATGDENYNHRMYYTLTSDFKEFTKAEVLYDHGFNVIDATIHKIDDEYVIFLKNETLLPEAEKNIRIATSSILTSGYSPASEPITDNWVEGPTAIKIDDNWIVYFDRYTESKMGAVISTDLDSWTDITDQLSFPEGTRHGTVFTVNRKVLNNLLNHESTATN